MASTGCTRADENRKIRREALRDQLRAKGLVQHVLDISEKLADLSIPLEPNEVQRLKAAADLKKGLIAKYLPDLKQVEVSGEDGEPIRSEERWTVEFINAAPANKPKT